MRLRLDVAYDGTRFSGWAVQPDRRTVQGELEAALRTLLRRADLSLTCAGRTDAGVHARGQVCHVDLPDDTDPAQLLRRIGRLLPEDVRVRAATEVGEDFDARFSALWRRYAYRVCDRPQSADPLRRHEVLCWRRPLDVVQMNNAGQALLGLHDFAAYCKRRDGATTVRTLLQLHWDRDSSGLCVCTVVADAFCHHLVRSLVGALLAVGEGGRSTDWPGAVLRAGVRDSAVQVAPAHGLTLEEVGYPAAEEWADRATTARAMRSRP